MDEQITHLATPSPADQVRKCAVLTHLIIMTEKCVSRPRAYAWGCLSHPRHPNRSLTVAAQNALLSRAREQAVQGSLILKQEPYAELRLEGRAELEIVRIV